MNCHPPHHDIRRRREHGNKFGGSGGLSSGEGRCTLRPTSTGRAPERKQCKSLDLVDETGAIAVALPGNFRRRVWDSRLGPRAIL
jgi:hypothetical protein